MEVQWYLFSRGGDCPRYGDHPKDGDHPRDGDCPGETNLGIELDCARDGDL